ncbi:MAG: methyltransferase domain-containing protein [Chloroflexota bacterium]|nr:methyltransferase domain-containing protein [Chloroflexota bacterium]
MSPPQSHEQEQIEQRPRDWDAATYDRVSDAHARWGADVVSRLRLAGDESVLDAGCGSGRVTEQLLARLPRGRVIGLDASPRMLAEAGRRLERYGDRVAFVCADLNQPLPLVRISHLPDRVASRTRSALPGTRNAGSERQVAAILSTATFHWLPDHDALFSRLAAALQPDGQLVAQCGGAGCIATVVDALRSVGDGWPGPWHFATAEATRQRLEAAGFVDVQTWLNDEPTPLEAGEPLETFLATVVLGAHLDRMPERERAPFVSAVAARLPHPDRPVIDYVRLNIVARRPAS